MIISGKFLQLFVRPTLKSRVAMLRDQLLKLNDLFMLLMFQYRPSDIYSGYIETHFKYVVVLIILVYT